MLVNKEANLKNSFDIKSIAKYLVTIESESSLKELSVFLENHDEEVLVLGEGTNVVLPDYFDGVVIKTTLNDLTYMSDQIEFVRRHMENLTGKTLSWKDSLQTSINNLYQIYKGIEILQQEFEVDLLTLNSRDQEKSKQLLELTHDIVEHEVDISLNRQNIGMVSDTIQYINNGLAIAEDNLAKNINQTFVLSGSTANLMDDIKDVSNEIVNNKSQVDIMSGSVANLYREVQRVEKSFDFINKSIKENRGSIGLNQQSINSNHSAILDLGAETNKQIDNLYDSLRVAQGELISTMELLWKQNKKSVLNATENFNDSLYSVNRNMKNIDNRTDDLKSDLDLYILPNSVLFFEESNFNFNKLLMFFSVFTVASFTVTPH